MRSIPSILQILGLFAFYSLFSGPASATIVQFNTSLGNIEVELYDTDAPVTVANFLNYVNSGRYNGTFIHRSAPGFILQGGGYFWSNSVLNTVTEDPPIINEYSPSRSNLRGTIAMAKLPTGPDTATSQFFFNLADNSANLDTQNGGFTVFGHVILGMDVVDNIASPDRILPWFLTPCPAPFDEMPLLVGIDHCPSTSELAYLIYINSAQVKNIIYPYINIQGNEAVIFIDSSTVVLLNVLTATTNLSNVTANATPTDSNIPDSITFDKGFFNFQLDNVTATSSTIIIMQLPSGFQPNTFYLYGPTSDNLSPHWYEFKFDGVTGAEFSTNTIALHFVDGARGDSDLTTNGQISITGAPGIDNNTSTTFSRNNNVGALSWTWLLLFVAPLAWRRK